MNFFKQIANSISRPNVNFSNFDMSHEHKTTMRFGELVPVMCEEILPGDKWHINPNAFVRTMPLLSPMFHKVDLKMRFFFVPNRLVWDKWAEFISHGNDKNGELFVPTFSFDGHLSPDEKREQIETLFGKGSLADYFGYRPPVDGEDFSISQLPFRAYDLIYQEYFCNQWVSPYNVRNSFEGARFYNRYGDKLTNDPRSMPGNSNIPSETKYEWIKDLFLPENVTFEPDYFTSCAPTPMTDPGTSGIRLGNDGKSVRIGGHQAIEKSLYPIGDYSTSAQPTISELRQAFRLQNFLENSLRVGKRYVEQLFAHFGVESSDGRMQRPEYLGGGKLAIQISEVASTAESGNIQLGDLAGRGISVGSFGDINFTSEEHGYLFGIAYIVPHTSYYGGIPRTFLRHERFDYAFPEFATLGEQPVFVSELDASYNVDGKNTKIFGYVPRYSEYKQSMDKFSGGMVDNLAYWHLGRNMLNSDPALNENFIYIHDEARRELNRVFGVTDPKEHPFYCSFNFQSNALRPLPFNPQTFI